MMGWCNGTLEAQNAQGITQRSLGRGLSYLKR